MNLEDCIIRALNGRKITQKQAANIREMAATSEADDRRLLELFIQNTQEKQRTTQLQAIASKRNSTNVAAHPDGQGAGVLGIFTRDLKGRAPYSNIDGRQLAIQAELHGHFAEAMSRYRTKNLTFSQDVAGIKRMVQELFGEASGDTDAAKFAQLWRETADMARQRFNVAGGNMPKRKDWGLPHSHDVGKIAAATFEEWRDFIVPRLDRARMYDSMGNRMSQNSFDTLIKDLYTQFSKQAKETATDIDRTVPNRVDHRMLTFKDSAGWLEYNQKFGRPDIYQAMLEHLNRMGGDTGVMEILGPYPDGEFRRLKKVAADSGATPITLKTIEAVYSVVTGRVNQTQDVFAGLRSRIDNLLAAVHLDVKVPKITSAGAGAATRNMLTFAHMGSAVISSLGQDQFVAHMRMGELGVKVPAWRFIGQIFKMMNPANEADRTFAVHMGLSGDAWLTRAIRGYKWGDMTGHGLSARISDITMRAGLLKPMTDAGEWAVGLDLSRFVAEQAGKTFKELPELFQKGLGRYGITAEHWDVIRAAPLIDREGVKYIRPRDIFEQSARGEAGQLSKIFTSAAQDVEAEASMARSRAGALGVRMEAHGATAREAVGRIDLSRDAANKLGEFFNQEMRRAFTEPDARIQAIRTGGAKAGSFVGEAMRDVTLFKSFSMAMISQQLYGMFEHEGIPARARYLSKLLIGMTVFGAAQIQMRNIIKGKDLQEMNDPWFWVQAVAQSGGLGLMQDFIFADENRYGKKWVMTALGPVTDLIDDVQALTFGNAWTWARAQDAKLAADIVKYGKKYTTKLWYTRLAFERILWDQLQKLADPHANESFRRIMQGARKDFGTEYWWRPGETAPQRAPDVGRALGE